MNIPNTLTVARVALTALMIVCLLLGGAAWAWISLFLFCIAALTDMLDGRLARAGNIVTNFGKFMDPLADKILNYSAMILLIPEGLVSPVAVVIILFREFGISGIRLAGAEQGVVIAANIWGKIKTLFQDISLIVILLLRAAAASFLPVLAGILPPLSNALIWICAVLTVISGVIYMVQNLGVIKER